MAASRDPVARCSCCQPHRIYTDYWATAERPVEQSQNGRTAAKLQPRQKTMRRNTSSCGGNETNKQAPCAVNVSFWFGFFLRTCCCCCLFLPICVSCFMLRSVELPEIYMYRCMFWLLSIYLVWLRTFLLQVKRFQNYCIDPFLFYRKQIIIQITYCLNPWRGRWSPKW